MIFMIETTNNNNNNKITKQNLNDLKHINMSWSTVSQMTMDFRSELAVCIILKKKKSI